MLDELTNEQIEEELESISTKIDSLYDRSHELNKELKKRNSEKVDIFNSALGIKNGVSVVAVAKHLDYHLSLIKIYDNLKLDSNEVSYILHDYRLDDYDLSYRVTKKESSKDIFSDLKDEFLLYTVDNYDILNDIVLSFTSLQFDEKNYKSSTLATLKTNCIGSVEI